MRYKLMTSNVNKLAEYKRLGLDADIGGPSEDLDEPDTSGDEVALRKALASGPYTIVEDTSLDVEGADIGVNIRWFMDNLSDLHGHKAKFKVYLARNNGITIDVFEGTISGVIDITKLNKSTKTKFGFDPVFVPDNCTMSLSELNDLGLKDQYSARGNACLALKQNKILRSVAIETIEPWAGTWQGM